jgi:hypothetical protein
LALALAAFQTADLVVSQVSPKYGADHLDHLGVPQWLRPVLPAIKLWAVALLVATATRPRLRSRVAAALVAYYSSAVAFHVASGDETRQLAPAAACAASAAVLYAAGAGSPRTDAPTSID